MIRIPRPRVLLLDLDNTLVDREAAFEAWAAALVPPDLMPGIVAVDAGGYGPKLLLYRAVARASGLSVAAARESFLTDFARYVRSRPDADALLAAFGGPKVIVTNGLRRLQRAKLVCAGLVGRVDHVCISDEVGAEKPDPAIFHAALACAGCGPEDALMIGDHPVNDIAGALGVGIPAVFVRSRWFADPVGVPAVALLTEIAWA
ncbi:MAG: HAD-IA family hydrolase [Pseudomonadota bacterium]|nr:HAD-IA family hydrolase [Pseudomonadota bacterium]